MSAEATAMSFDPAASPYARTFAFESDFVAVAEEGKQRLQLMIAVGPPRTHVQREVDLGGRAFGDDVTDPRFRAER